MPMHVLLLAGGTSNERDVSLRSGQSVADALTQQGHTYTLADPGAADFSLTDALKDVVVVFPALHGEGGEDGSLQTELEARGVKFVGSGSQASKLCWDKWAYKQFLRENNLPASAGQLVTANDVAADIFNQPYVLKPVAGGSSLDTQVVRTPDEASKQASRELLERYESMLVEPLIEGTEITVGVLGDEALPVIEIIPPSGKEFDYENKYNGATQELCPPQNVSQEIQEQAQALALRVHQLTGCAHLSRTDIMIDRSGNLHILETNTLPGMTSTSLLPKMAQTAGLSMAELVDKLLLLATA